MHNTIRWFNEDNEDNDNQKLIDIENLADMMGMLKGDAVKKMRKQFGEEEVFRKCSKNSGNVLGGRPKTNYYFTIKQATHFAMDGTTEMAKFVRDYFIDAVDYTHMYEKLENLYNSNYDKLENNSDNLIKYNGSKPVTYMTYPYEHQLDDDSITIKVGSTEDITDRNKGLKNSIGKHAFIACFPSSKARAIEKSVKQHPDFAAFQRDIFIKGKRHTEFFTFQSLEMVDRMLKFIALSVESHVSTEQTEQSRQATEQKRFEFEMKKMEHEARMEQLKMERLKLEFEIDEKKRQNLPQNMQDTSSTQRLSLEDVPIRSPERPYEEFEKYYQGMPTYLDKFLYRYLVKKEGNMVSMLWLWKVMIQSNYTLQQAYSFATFLGFTIYSRRYKVIFCEYDHTTKDWGWCIMNMDINPVMKKSYLEQVDVMQKIIDEFQHDADQEKLKIFEWIDSNPYIERFRSVKTD